MSSKVSYFSFEEFKNKIVGFWHWKRPLSVDMGSLGLQWTELWVCSPSWGWHVRLLCVVFVLWLTPIQSCKDAVETDAEPGTTPMCSPLMPSPPALPDFSSLSIFNFEKELFSVLINCSYNPLLFFCVSVILFYNKVIIKGIQTLICWLLINVSMLHVGLESGDCFRETWKIGSFSNTKAEHSFPYPSGLLTGYISKV